MDDLLTTADSLDELLAAASRVEAPTLGFVHKVDGKCRWITMNLGGPTEMRVGETLYAHARQSPGLGHRVEHELGHPIDGWIFAAPAWHVESPWPAAEGRLSEHPNRTHAQLVIWMDRTGAVIARTHRGADTDTVELPPHDGSRDPEVYGSLIAALDMFRCPGGPS